jgi:hypothetical protein
MRYRKFWIGSLVVMLGMILTVDAVQADPEDSNASITFTEGGGIPPVLDPENPDPDNPFVPSPERPTDPQDYPTDQAGPLTLDYVSSIEFGEQPIQANTETYQSTTLRPFIQVSDRRGTGEGWHVTAQASNFSNTEEVTLPGATINFTGGSVTSNNTTGSAPEASDNIILNSSGDAADVVSADLNTGMGSWITRWFPTEQPVSELNDNVTLTVPAGSATTGNHTATITWTLTSGPQP